MLSVPTLDREFTYNLGYMSRVSQRPDGVYSGVLISGSEKAAAVKVYRDVCRRFVVANMNIQSDDHNYAEAHAQTYVSSSDLLIRPPDILTDFSVKEGISHEEFEKRKKAGEIMMSDYKRGTFLVRERAGFVAESQSFRTSPVPFQSLVDAGLMTEITVSTSNGNLQVASIGPYTYSKGLASPAFSYWRNEMPSGYWHFQRCITAESVMSSVRAHKPEFTSLVTQVLAKANKSSVDVLTAFAEAPKSIVSVIRGFKLVASMLKDAKKGEFSLTEGHKWRKQATTDRYKRQMLRIDRELSSKKISSSRRKALIRHRADVDVGYRQYLIKSADELASSLADLWLNYRYNIMPNVYLAQDVFEAVINYGREWIRSSGTINSSISIPVHGNIRIDADERRKVLIKRSFSKPKAEQGLTVISNDMFVTAWELIPLSFVYDWFLNVGDLLAAQSYSLGWEQQGAVTSVKISIDAEIQCDDNLLYAIEPRTVVRGSYYERNEINPIDHCGLVWQPTLGLERYLDLVSLSWRPVRSLLLKGRNK